MDNKALRRRINSTVNAAALDIVRRYRFQPKRLLGQNFLIDDSVYDDILAAAAVSLADTVLEIGAGLGTLTERLSPLAKNVVAVELDRRLAAILRDRLSVFQNAEIFQKNILAAPVSDFGLSQPYKVVANIPYNITGAVFKKFLMQDIQPSAMTLLVQREVGERIIAADSRMSLLALSVQLYGAPKIVRHVPASSFYPQPKVEGVILQVSVIHPFPFIDIDEKFFWQTARICFSAKRKQLHNNLAAGFNLTAVQAAAALKEAGLSPLVRAENLKVTDWYNLAKAVRRMLSH